MRVQLVKRYRFEAAHRLPRVRPDHKCARLHGHSYRLVLVLAGEVDPQQGWLLDFDEIDERMAPIIDQLDHRYLNEVEGLDNPTAELIARWVWARAAALVPLYEVQVEETCEASCVYRGD